MHSTIKNFSILLFASFFFSFYEGQSMEKGKEDSRLTPYFSGFPIEIQREIVSHVDEKLTEEVLRAIKEKDWNSNPEREQRNPERVKNLLSLRATSRTLNEIATYFLLGDRFQEYPMFYFFNPYAHTKSEISFRDILNHNVSIFDSLTSQESEIKRISESPFVHLEIKPQVAFSQEASSKEVIEKEDDVLRGNLFSIGDLFTGDLPAGNSLVRLFFSFLKTPQIESYTNSHNFISSISPKARTLTIILSYSQEGDKNYDEEFLENFSSQKVSFPQLNNLTIYHCITSPINFYAFSSFFLSRFPLLSSLTLNTVILRSHVSSIPQSPWFPTLTSLNLSRTQLNDENTKIIIESLKKGSAACLSELKLFENQITDMGLILRADIPTLEKLSLSYNPIECISSEDLQSCSFTGLTHLDLSSTPLTYESLKNLSNGPFSELTNLDLESVKQTEETFLNFARNYKKLEKYSVSTHRTDKNFPINSKEIRRIKKEVNPKLTVSY